MAYQAISLIKKAAADIRAGRVGDRVSVMSLGLSFGLSYAMSLASTLWYLLVPPRRR